MHHAFIYITGSGANTNIGILALVATIAARISHTLSLREKAGMLRPAVGVLNFVASLTIESNGYSVSPLPCENL